MLSAELLTATLTRYTQPDKPLIAVTPDRKNPAAALKLEVGQQVQGMVQTKVAPGVFQVRIAERTIQMQLPAFVRSGDLIALQVVSLQPRLIFSLAASSNPLSTSEQLGATARLLSSLAQQAVRQDYVPSAQRTPLWISAQDNPDPVQLAQRLHHTLSHSGLFYESHQAQWIAGQRTTPQLMQEPQNQSPPTPKEPGVAMRQNAIPEALQLIVQQQLHTLENRQVVWQGPVWPGQEMRWKVGEERNPAPGTPEENHWVTELKLELPRLGSIDARLRFKGNAVIFELAASNATATRTLQDASAQLVSALNARGVPVLQTRISLAAESAA